MLGGVLHAALLATLIGSRSPKLHRPTRGPPDIGSSLQPEHVVRPILAAPLVLLTTAAVASAAEPKLPDAALAQSGLKFEYAGPFMNDAGALVYPIAGVEFFDPTLLFFALATRFGGLLPDELGPQR